MSGTGFEAMHIFKSQILHIRSEDGKQYQRDAKISNSSTSPWVKH